MLKNEHGYVYNKLVSDQDDIFSIVAYAIYKRNKIEYIEDLKNKGIEPTDERLSQYQEMISLPSQLKLYKASAETLINSAISSELQRREEQIRRDYEDELHRIEQDYQFKLEKKIYPFIESNNKYWFGFWKGVVQSVVGSVVLAAIVILSVKFNLIDVSKSIDKSLDPPTHEVKRP
ncbi:hypothetical protein KJ940_17985 [Myxococcota bacterium]|nr:hypothetical protein [Myxococcota bacterium]